MASRKRTIRSARKTKLKYDEHGNPLCRWCSKAVQPPRKTFCSNECVHEWRLRSSVSYARQCVRERDKGVCSKCGIDTYKISRGMRRPLKDETEAQWQKRVTAIRKKFKVGPKRVTLWDLDHDLEVAAGGGLCGLENMRTLCIPCHKKKTKKFVKKLSKERSKKKKKA